MKILFVCRYKNGFEGNMIPFNREFVLSLRSLGIQVEIMTIRGRWPSYIKSIFSVNKLLRQKSFDIIHASYGLSGLVISFQEKTPSVVTFVGSDIYNNIVRFIAKSFVIKRLKASIFVSQSLFNLAGRPQKGIIIPFGVDLKKFYPIDQSLCRRDLKMAEDIKYVLFSGRFDRVVKNSTLALEAINKTGIKKIKLVELRDIPEEKINSLFNACDICLMTSFSEGSPQFIKEAMACNKPVVSTDVGDVAWIFGNTAGHYISSNDSVRVADKINTAIRFLESNESTAGRERLKELKIDIDSATKRVIGVYNSLIP